MSTTQRAMRRMKKPFDRAEFELLHEAVSKLDFTPDFNPSIETILDMPDVALTERVMALVKLQAWGNQKLCAVHDYARNKPFTEADCARRLDVRRQRINEDLKKLVMRCQLRIEDGKLYPVPDPDAERTRKMAEVVRNGGASPSPNLRFLKQRWFAEHPEIRDQYQKAFQFIASVNKQIEAAIRETQLSDPLAVSAMAESGHEAAPVPDTWPRNRPDTPAPPLRTTEPPILIEKEEGPAKELESASSSFSLARRTLSEYGTVDDDVFSRLLTSCRQKCPDPTDEELAHFIAEKGKLVTRKITNPVGFLLTAVPKCFEGESFREYRAQRRRRRQTEAERSERERIESQRFLQEQRAVLADPNAPEKEKAFIRDVLGIAAEPEEPERKPAEREIGENEQTMAAGKGLR